jgi:hypothetical protein
MRLVESTRILALRLASRWKQWVAQRSAACVVERCGESYLAHSPAHTIFIREYYLYCVKLFRAELSRTALTANFVIGNYNAAFGNALPTLSIDIQHEHTLVVPGGRDSDGALSGSIPLLDCTGHYLVRIENLDYLLSRDIVIEYSLPNIANVSSAQKINEYKVKNVHIAPVFYDTKISENTRRIEIVSLFADTKQRRRRQFLDHASTSGLRVRNVSGVYDGALLQKLYRDTRILVNVHQTDHHHTFEELRVLPALLCGVVVVSETVPLREEIPYHDFIVWCDYDQIIDTVRAVRDDYESYRRKMFGDGRFKAIISAMRKRNHDNVQTALKRVATAIRSANT